MEINYVTGDATLPEGPGHKTIAHICNNQGGWGRGFVVALGARYPLAESEYRQWSSSSTPPRRLGAVQVVRVADDVAVANLIAQNGYRAKENPVPLDFAALERCLRLLSTHPAVVTGSVHMPRIGTDLAGGRWDQIVPIIERTLLAAGIDVTVYTLPTI